MKLPNFKGKFQGTLQTLAGHGTFKLYHGWLWYIYMHHGLDLGAVLPILLYYSSCDENHIFHFASYSTQTEAI